ASLHHHQTHLGRLQTRDKRANSLRLVWALLDRIDQTRDVQTCLRNINTDHHRLCLSHRASPSPNLAKMRASLGLTQPFGIIKEIRSDDTCSSAGFEALGVARTAQPVLQVKSIAFACPD